MMCVWRWDKKECELRFPLKDALSVFKFAKASQEATTSQLCFGGSKKGVLSVWSAFDGNLLSEVDSAHFMEITDLDVSPFDSDMVVTGGKDNKVKVWLMQSILKEGTQQVGCLHEFS